jgi:hypothetical protein
MKTQILVREIEVVMAFVMIMPMVMTVMAFK